MKSRWGQNQAPGLQHTSEPCTDSCQSSNGVPSCTDSA